VPRINSDNDNHEHKKKEPAPEIMQLWQLDGIDFSVLTEIY
jgi:hypothetical protein